jgi:ubiquinone/menaquinone biosynthesis C-methylase UbiE
MDLGRLSSYGFAGVICTSAFHYFANPREALSKMHGELLEGGSVYLIERDKSASLLTVLWDFLHRHLIKDHVRFYSSGQLQSMLGQAGFSNIEVLETVNRYFWHGKLQTNIVFLRGQKAKTQTEFGLFLKKV